MLPAITAAGSARPGLRLKGRDEAPSCWVPKSYKSREAFKACPARWFPPPSPMRFASCLPGHCRFTVGASKHPSSLWILVWPKPRAISHPGWTSRHGISSPLVSHTASRACLRSTQSVLFVASHVTRSRKSGSSASCLAISFGPLHRVIFRSIQFDGGGDGDANVSWYAPVRCCPVLPKHED